MREEAVYSDGSRVRTIRARDEFQRPLRVEVYGSTDRGGALEFWRTYSWDETTGRLASVHTPQGRLDYTYDSQGRLESVSTSWGSTTEYSYNEFGSINAASKSLPGGTRQAVEYTFEPSTGRKATAAYGNGATTSWTYDPQGRVASIEHQDAAMGELMRLEYERYERGPLKLARERGGGESGFARWDYTYDIYSRMKTANFTAGGAAAPEATYSYDYDISGNRILENANGTERTFVYNSLGQLTSETGGAQGPRSFEYDLFGNVQLIRNGTVPSAELSWDCRDRLQSLKAYDHQGWTKRPDRISGANVSAIRLLPLWWTIPSARPACRNPHGPSPLPPNY